jgi:class 3 adenylate cyclase
MSDLLVPALNFVRWVATAVIILTIFSWLLGFFPDLQQLLPVDLIISLEGAVNGVVRSLVPTRFGGIDFSRVMTVAAAIFISDVARSQAARIRFANQKREFMADIHRIPRAAVSAAQQNRIAQLERKMEDPEAAKGKSRQDLLKEFAQLKKELEKSGRNLAFLAVDVADSIGLKAGEDPSIVEHDFLAYREFVEGKFRRNSLIRATWTPDGTMACFPGVAEAFGAARDILHGLGHFNRSVKCVKRDFRVRCGLNAGHVFYDDTMPLEQFSDRVIDTAGHMQKYAAPGTLWISASLIEPLAEKAEFTKVDQLVDGVEVAQWTPPAPAA